MVLETGKSKIIVHLASSESFFVYDYLEEGIALVDRASVLTLVSLAFLRKLLMS